MAKKKLSPGSKRIRQMIMHRITRTMNKQTHYEAFNWKAVVHDAVTTTLQEELDCE